MDGARTATGVATSIRSARSRGTGPGVAGTSGPHRAPGLRTGLRAGAAALIPALALSIAPPARASRSLTFEERVRAQEAIERVYWSHRIWPESNPTPKPPLSELLPEEALRERVEDYLRKSRALEALWQRPITADQLQAEIDRMARSTRAPEVLRELFAALENDPYVIAETLARQTLAERLLRNGYATDSRFHGALREEAESAIAAAGGRLGAVRSPGATRHEVRWVLRPTGPGETAAPLRDRPDAGRAREGEPVGIELDEEEWERLRARLRANRGTGPSRVDPPPIEPPTALAEHPDRFEAIEPLSFEEDAIVAVVLSWPKVAFEAWWKGFQADLTGDPVVPPAAYLLPAVESVNCVAEDWRATFTGTPLERYVHTAVWTGTEMIVWGGSLVGSSAYSSGGRYDPSTDTWTSTAMEGAPAARGDHTAVWTGTEMIVWGGWRGGSPLLNTGGRYSPTADRWTPTSLALAPESRVWHRAVWTGTEMIVWGGVGVAPDAYLETGGRYDPSTDTWIATSTTGAPRGRYGHTAVWTGTEMIVWGGAYQVGDLIYVLASGGRYNPASDSWTDTSLVGAPSARFWHTAVWTGTQMIVWGGGVSIGVTNTGGRYRPSTDTWTSTDPGPLAPSARSRHTAVWTGSEMIVWGGHVDATALGDGKRYRPSTNSWHSMESFNAPSARSSHTAVWTGTEMIVWGGSRGYGTLPFRTGGRYSPSSDAWTSTSVYGAPADRANHTAVWTGTEMIVWGGSSVSNGAGLNDGGRYRPSTDSWTATTRVGAPTARDSHTAVWSGSLMIVWGGYSGSGPTYFATGGRYRPDDDTWSATSTTGAPSARTAHTAVWTGSEMIVWGGARAEGSTWVPTLTGGHYDPSTDAWTPTSTGAAPLARDQHTAVWTGSQMIVWGGFGDSSPLNTGGRYDPSTKAWTPTSTAGAPTARGRHTAVWTGSEMIVWGNSGDSSGGRYDPSTDAWSSTSTAGAPTARHVHTAVWTGREMIVWGGSDYSAPLNTGGRYDPSTDAWSSTSTAGDPPVRAYHTAVWTGNEMIVWGGHDGMTLNTGGRYTPGNDGASCDDGNACTTGDACSAGVCVGGPPLVCDDGNLCTDDSCNPAGGCVHVNNTAPCDDGDVCTTADACSFGVCAGAPLPDCSQPATIRYPPTPQSAILGSTAVFTVIASGEPPLTYRWRKGGVDLVDGGRVRGATSDTLVLRDVRADDEGGYSVVVQNEYGASTSGEALLTVVVPRGGDVDSFFDPGSSIDGIVLAVAVQPDEKILVGGEFTSVPGGPRARIARLNRDGSVDHSFQKGMEGADASVWTVAVQPDGRVWIGGDFTRVNGATRNSIARLKADGTLDSVLGDPSQGANGRVTAIAVQPDGRVLIGGSFTMVHGVARNYLARLHGDGSLDSTFLDGMEGPDSGVHGLALRADGRVLIAGDFTTVHGVSRNRVAQLNVDGSLDATFLDGMAGADGRVQSIAVQPDGRVLIGGFFTTVNDVTRNGVARLNPDGGLDTTFQNGMAGADGGVYAVAVQPDGRALVVGEFTSVNGVARNRVARLNADGSLDTTFQDGMSGADAEVFGLALQPDGRVLIGGDFRTVNGESRRHIARLAADGTLDGGFPSGSAGADETVYAVVALPDERVLIAGAFTHVDRLGRNRVARLHADGRLDTTFLDGMAGPGNRVDSVAIQQDGRVLIGGWFTSVHGVARNRIARLDTDGSLDATFQNGMPGADGVVQAIVVQPDGRVLIGGWFTSVNGVARNRIARLDTDGSLDTTFQNGMPGANGIVKAVALQPDGKVLIGGNFTTVNGVARNRIARLNADGSLDTSFQNGMAGANGSVDSVAVQPDGKVLIGGNFTTVNGVTRNRIARLNVGGSLDTTFQDGMAGADSSVVSVALQPDGGVLLGGVFTTVNGVTRNRIARVHADGRLDSTFQDGMAGANHSVRVVALLSDQRVIIGGDFTAVNGVPRDRVAVLYGSTPVAPTITAQPSPQVSYDGCCAVFRVGATGTPLYYRWRKDGVDLLDGPSVSGAASRTLTIRGVSGPDAGTYDVRVWNVLGSTTSDGAQLTVATEPACKVGACHPILGCVLVDAANGTPCDDGTACTTGETCAAGACAGGTPLVCDDGAACTADSCHASEGCVYTPFTPPLASGLVASSVTEFRWNDLGEGYLYDVLRGVVGQWPVGTGWDETCQASELPSATTTDTTVPAAGTALYYLVRVDQGGCKGSYGAASGGAPRTSGACP